MLRGWECGATRRNRTRCFWALTSATAVTTRTIPTIMRTTHTSDSPESHSTTWIGSRWRPLLQAQLRLRQTRCLLISISHIIIITEWLRARLQWVKSTERRAVDRAERGLHNRLWCGRARRAGRRDSVSFTNESFSVFNVFKGFRRAPRWEVLSEWVQKF